MLTRWKLNGPNPLESSRGGTGPCLQSAEAELPAVDLRNASDNSRNSRTAIDDEAQRYCSLRFAAMPEEFKNKQSICEQREYERLKHRTPFGRLTQKRTESYLGLLDSARGVRHDSTIWPPTILIVDDDPGILLLCTKVLEGAGYRYPGSRKFRGT
ncbi:MAG: hypothetical protein U0231_11745 [Nitrospiraceae bacterium]